MRAAEDTETSVFHPAKFNRASFSRCWRRETKLKQIIAGGQKPKEKGASGCIATQLQADLGFGVRWVQPRLPSRLPPFSWVADSGSGDQKQFPDVLN